MDYLFHERRKTMKRIKPFALFTAVLMTAVMTFTGCGLDTEALSDEAVIDKTAVKKAFKTCYDPDKTTTFVLGDDVEEISAGVFKRTNITTLRINTTKLTEESVKDSLEGSKVSEIVINLRSYDDATRKKYLEKYTKIFTDSDIAGKTTGGNIEVNMLKEEKSNSDGNSIYFMYVPRYRNDANEQPSFGYVY